MVCSHQRHFEEALQITPVNNNQAFVAPPSSDALINFVNKLGYPKLVRNLSNVVTNDMFQPWRALTTIINLCLTGKTSGFERPRAPRRHRFYPRPDSPLYLPNEEPVLGYLKFSAKDTMADVNANAPAGQAPTMAPPVRTDDQILPCIRWWFDLTKDTLRAALQITPVNNNRAFISPPSFDALINFVNESGYPKLVRNLSNVVTNDMFQPWRALTTIINMCLTGKTSGFERPRALVLQILWVVLTQTHIDYAERIWEEFTQSIHTFIDDKRNLAQHTSEKKRPL
nr:hypothetical protein [Tanacetum cinerariifolium]